jgi:tRNA(Ile)-lysidine synthetase-like protein
MSKWIYSQSVPENVYVACSGGVDSVAAAAILSEWRKVTLIHYSHHDYAHQFEFDLVSTLANKLAVNLITMSQPVVDIKDNKEAKWRDARYQWFHKMNAPIATGHTLDDAVEWYMMTCLRGRGEFMPVKNRNVFRPFLLTDKNKLVDYCKHRNLDWWEDPGNTDINFSLRSRIRNTLIPVALDCEPGLKNMVRRRLIEKNNERME